MKKRLYFSLVLGLLLIVTAVQAQVKLGVKAGLNLATIPYTTGGRDVDIKTLNRYTFGILYEIPLTTFLALQPGIFYSAKGSKYTNEEKSTSISSNYIEIPINALCKIDLGSAKFLLFAGPYVAYGISGEITNTYSTYSIAWGSSEDSDLRRTDYGVNYGAGIEISNFQITVQYGVGLANILPSAYKEQEAKNKVTGISIAYLFGSKE